MKKPRGEAILKNLPDALQEELWQVARRTTYPKAIAWLKEKHEITITEGPLSKWFGWYPRSLTLRMAAETSSQLEQTILKMPELKIAAAQAREVAQASFEIQAARDRDAKLFLDLGELRLKEKKSHQDERRIALLEKKAAQADKAEGVTRDETLTPEAREQKLKEIFGLK